MELRQMFEDESEILDFLEEAGLGAQRNFERVHASYQQT